MTGHERALRFLLARLSRVRGTDFADVPVKILGRVKDISGATYGDDATCLLLPSREARVLNILTGPPAKEG
jgi:hypothetical protein